MPDLITFVKNLTPGVTETCKMVDGRQADLTHQVHRDLLNKHTMNIKKTLPLLISAMKAFVSTLEKGMLRYLHFVFKSTGYFHGIHDTQIFSNSSS